MFKFRQKKLQPKTFMFYVQRQVTDMITIDVNQVMVSDKVSCMNGKDHRYLVGYQVDERLIPVSVS